MTVVVDASVVAKWFFPEDGSAEARALAGAETIVTVDLLVPEIVNVAWRKVRTGDATRQDVIVGTAIQVVVTLSTFQKIGTSVADQEIVT